MLIQNKKYLWLWRAIMAVLLILIFVNRMSVIARFNSSSWWGLLAVNVISWITVEWLLNRIRISTLKSYLLVIVSGFAVYADVLGTLYSLYDKYYRYDWLIHFIVPAVITVWIWYALKLMIKLPAKWHAWIVLTTSIFLGNIFEFAEYAADTFWVGGYYWISNTPDTVEDILFNALGASVTVITMEWITCKKKFTKN